MAHTVCCRLRQEDSYFTEVSWLHCSLHAGTGTGVNTLTNNALAEQLHLLSILHERIKLLYLPPHGKMKDECNGKEKGSRGLHSYYYRIVELSP
ncbi:hypothetical protein AVEN_21802-1 [Araneus ventricosus]|uniref:Uncharacterized protein n=1 Tax=Araneus ventricosus TaxID=182803 RepID=A0A4Y2IQG8_ARAVE|nr:hypothetical protein AVEN_21802-1 [Araneus ventricosus]